MTNDLPTPLSPLNLPETVAPPEPSQAPRLEATTPVEPSPTVEESHPSAEPTVPDAVVNPVAAEPAAMDQTPPNVEVEAPTEEAPAEVEAETPAETPPAAEPEPATNKRWYVIKVQSGREESIKEAIERRVKIEGLEEFFGQIVIPTERVVEMRRGKRVYKDKKLYPGYLMAEVEFNDRILYLFRETSGVGDFVSSFRHPSTMPMTGPEVGRMTRKPVEAGPAGTEPDDPTKVSSTAKPPVRAAAIAQ